MVSTPSNLLRLSAMNLLARREHSRKELEQKLSRNTDDPNLLQVVLDQLEKDRLLSNERFTTSFIRSHINKGHGPVRIRQELYIKGISDELADNALEAADANWYDLAKATRTKKFGITAPSEAKEKARQIRFLQYRGFPIDLIMELFSENNSA